MYKTFNIFQGKMDNCNDGTYEISADDVNQLKDEEICEHLSLNGLNAKGSRSELAERLKRFLDNVAVQNETITDYTFEMNKLKKVVVQIKNLNSEPLPTDMTLLEKMAKDLTRRMPLFKPKYPGFHRYGKPDLVAQDYIQYLPEMFTDKYVAIWTNPNGRNRKCPLG